MSSSDGRLNEYFVVVGLGNHLTPCENDGSLFHDGSSSEDFHGNEAERKTSASNCQDPLETEYQPTVLDRFPFMDRDDVPFPPGIALFCFPEGFYFTRHMTIPKFSFFVHTNAMGEKLYGTCVHFHEELAPVQRAQLEARITAYWEELSRSPTGLTPTSSTEDFQTQDGTEFMGAPKITPEYQSGLQGKVYVPKCLCVLARWPFPEPSREWLAHLYRLHTQPYPLPVERVVANFMFEVPLPMEGSAVQCQLDENYFTFSRPLVSSPFSPSSQGAPFGRLFECLSPENVLEVFTAVCLEKHILLCSSSMTTLAYAAEALISLLHPLEWCGVYIPLLPRQLLGVIDAPIPFILGLPKQVARFIEPQNLEKVLQVDLDENCLSCSSFEHVRMPERKRKTLLQAIRTSAPLFARRGADWKEFRLPSMDYAIAQAIHRPDDEPVDEIDEDGVIIREDWMRLRQTFFDFFVSMLKNHGQWLEPIDPKTAELEGRPPYTFREQEYIQGHKVDWVPFLTKFVKTQTFQNFLTAQALSKFGQRSDKVDHFNKAILLKLAKKKNIRSKLSRNPKRSDSGSADTLKTIVAPQPYSGGLPEGAMYTYKYFPTLDEALLTIPSPPQHTGTKRKSIGPVENNYRATRLVCQPVSIETAIYSTFFMTYSAMISSSYQARKVRKRKKDPPGPPADPQAKIVHSRPLSPRDAPDLDSFRMLSRSRSMVEGEYDFLESESNPARYSAPLPARITPDSLEEGALQVPPREPFGNQQNAGTPMARPMSAGSSRGPPKPQLIRRTHTDSEVNAEIVASRILQEMKQEAQAQDIAFYQLEVLFEVLQTMMDRSVAADELIYNSVIDACSSCGASKHAEKVVQEMRANGITPNVAMYGALIQSFATSISATASSPPDKSENAYAGKSTRRRSKSKSKSKLASPEAKEKRGATPKKSSFNFFSRSNNTGSEGEKNHTISLSDGFQRMTTSIFGQQQNRADDPSLLKRTMSNPSMRAMQTKFGSPRRRQSSGKSVVVRDPVLHPLDEQMDLSELVLAEQFPDLQIDLDWQKCPYCNASICFEDLSKAWTNDLHTYTIKCPHCQGDPQDLDGSNRSSTSSAGRSLFSKFHMPRKSTSGRLKDSGPQFAPRFTVHCSDPNWVGSDGPKSELECQFLSPWVLRKELDRILHLWGVDFLCSSQFRKQGHEIVFWNLLILFRKYHLPFAFLLQHDTPSCDMPHG